MSGRTFMNMKTKYDLVTIQHWRRFTSLARVLILAGLVLGSCSPGTTPQPFDATPSSEPYTLAVVEETTPPAAEHNTPQATDTGLPAWKTPPSWARTYYVDSSLGSDENNCIQAQNPATPLKSVYAVTACNPGPGQTVRFRGEFKETIIPRISGKVLYNAQDISNVEGSVVTFDQTLANIYPPTDYVTIYGSRKGNSGAYAILSVSGNHAIVDTSALPAGKFLPEDASDPGTLQAAILRPVHFTAWDKNEPPIYSGQYQAYHTINQRVIMVSYWKSIAGNVINPGWWVWPAFEIDGNNSGNSDFQIFDHLEVANAESAIAVESNDFQSNYDIIQFSNIHDIGYGGNEGHDAFVYFGFAFRPDIHHDFVQIMYNKIGPHKQYANAPYSTSCCGIEIKHSAHNATVFGNEIFGIEPNGCDNAPIKVSAPNAFIANNYVHDIDPLAHQGCGISIVNDMTPYNPGGGAYGTILANNIVARVRQVGIRVLNANNIQIINNTIYDIFPEPDCDSACMEENMGITIWNYEGPIEDIVIKNNIIQLTHIGIGRAGSQIYPADVDSNYNLVFDTDFPFFGTFTQNDHDLVMDPRFVDPKKHNFILMPDSPACDSGTNLTTTVAVDNHDAGDPTLPPVIPPVIRISPWDRGAYED